MSAIRLRGAKARDFQIAGRPVKRIECRGATIWQGQWNLKAGTLPAAMSYARTGTGATRFQAGTGWPKLTTIAADTPRFDLDSIDPAMRAIGLLMEGSAVNFCGYNRGTPATGWAASGLSATNVIGMDQTGTKARRLTASGANATYKQSAGMPSAAGVYVWSSRVRRQTGKGRVWLDLTHDTSVVDSRDISADLQMFEADNVTGRWVRCFVSGYYGASSIVSAGFRIEESGDAIDVDWPQLELSANGRGFPTSEIDTENVASATRNADVLTVDLGAAIGSVVLSGDDINALLDEEDIQYRALSLWRDREERHVAEIRIIESATPGLVTVSLFTEEQNLPNSGIKRAASSPVITEWDPAAAEYVSSQLFELPYTFPMPISAGSGYAVSYADTYSVTYADTYEVTYGA